MNNILTSIIIFLSCRCLYTGLVSDDIISMLDNNILVLEEKKIKPDYFEFCKSNLRYSIVYSNPTPNCLC